MNRRLVTRLFRSVIPVVILACLLAMLIPVSAVTADSVVTFPDPNLEAAIREAIGKPTGDIYQSDLSGLTDLVAYNSGIVDLTGLEYCTSLTGLSLHENPISDISPLSGLTSLNYLSFSITQTSDISPIAGLTNLVGLYIYESHITDISPIAGLTSLTYLFLDHNQISDISPIASLARLTDLSLWYNEVSDISPLSGLTNLGYLALGHNKISDIEPLADNPGIASGDLVYLCGNPLSSVSVNTWIPTLQDRGVTVDWCPSAWTDTFQDTQRGTTLYINTAEGTFCFTGPDGSDTGVVKAKVMRAYGERIWIWHMDDGIIFNSNVDAASGYCFAYLWDFATMKYYILLNIPTY